MQPGEKMSAPLADLIWDVFDKLDAGAIKVASQMLHQSEITVRSRIRNLRGIRFAKCILKHTVISVMQTAGNFNFGALLKLDENYCLFSEIGLDTAENGPPKVSMKRGRGGPKQEVAAVSCPDQNHGRRV